MGPKQAESLPFPKYQIHTAAEEYYVVADNDEANGNANDVLVANVWC